MAIKADRSLLRVPAMHRLYEIILAGDVSTKVSSEIHRMKEEIPDWPKTKMTAAFLSPEFGLMGAVVVIVFIVIRLLELRS